MATPAHITHFGLPGIDRVPFGMHTCHFYDNRDQLIAALVPYFVAGLRHNERCLWITAPPLPVREASEALRHAWNNVDDAIQAGALRILDFDQWYAGATGLKGSEVVQLWVEEEERALSDGYNGLRIAGNTSFLKEGDWSTFMEYEQTVSAHFKSRRIVALCSYALSQCTDQKMSEVLHSHDSALQSADDYWTMVYPERGWEDEIKRLLRTHDALWEPGPGESKMPGCGDARPDGLSSIERQPVDREKRFRDMIDALPVAIYTTDADGRLTHYNPAAVEFSGRVPILGSDEWCVSWKLYHSDGTPMPHHQCPMAVALKEGRSVRGIEAIAERPDGTRLWFMPLPTPLRSADGSIVGGINMLVDITARKRDEEAKAKLAAIVESSHDAIVSKNLNGIITSWNGGAERMFGYTAQEAIGQPVTMLMPPDRTSEETGILSRIRRGEKIDHFETIRRRKDGTLLNISLTSSPIIDANGRIIGASKIARDITERRRAEEALCQARDRFDIVRDGVQVGFWFCDLPFDRLTWDNRVKEHFWLPADADVTIETFYERLHPDDRTPTRQAIEESIANKTRYDIEYRTVSADTGQAKWIRAIGRTFYDGQDRPIRFDGVTLDITERKRAEEEAQRRAQQWNEELEQAVNIKTVELRQSHERLRALTTELDLTEQRERKRLAAELHDHLQQLLVVGKLKLGQGKRLSEAVPAVSKVIIEADEVLAEALKYTRTLVTELSPPVLRDHGLASGLRWLGEYMKKHDLSVTVTVPDKEVKLSEDQIVLLFQSVRELLINSSKHAGTGQATVTMEYQHDSIVIEVRDEGAGFDTAAVTGAATTSGGVSSKFGLFSIRERMRALEGSFIVHSASGEGTRATLVLPIRTSGECSVGNGDRTKTQGHTPASFENSLLSQNSKRIRILWVDDHVMVRQGIRAVLDTYADVELVGEAGDGEEAVELVERLRPEVVVMDINMPKMNGVEATRQIKSLCPETIVIGLSVNVTKENEEAMRRAGAVRLMTKEAAVEKLYETIHENVGK